MERRFVDEDVFQSLVWVWWLREDEEQRPRDVVSAEALRRSKEGLLSFFRMQGLLELGRLELIATSSSWCLARAPVFRLE